MKTFPMNPLTYAIAKHRGQKRKSGEAYIKHPLAVMKKVKEYGLGEELEQVAILHDVYEDCGVSQAELREKFGPAISEMVYSLSKRPKSEYQEVGAAQRLKDYLKRLERGMKKRPELVLIKLADQIDNVQSIEIFRKEKRERILREIKCCYFPLYERMKSEMTEELGAKYEKLKRELEEILERKDPRVSLKWWFQKVGRGVNKISRYLF